MKPRISQLAQSGATDGQVVTWDDGTSQWVPADPATGTDLAALATTKGQLLVATGVGTFVVLPPGTDGQVLSADSTTTTGLRWVDAGAPSAPGTYTTLYEGTY